MVFLKNDFILYIYYFNKYKIKINSKLIFVILVDVLYGLSLFSEVGVTIISMPSSSDLIPPL